MTRVQRRVHLIVWIILGPALLLGVATLALTTSGVESASIDGRTEVAP